jgi:hypothetical protein
MRRILIIRSSEADLLLMNKRFLAVVISLISQVLTAAEISSTNAPGSTTADLATNSLGYAIADLNRYYSVRSDESGATAVSFGTFRFAAAPDLKMVLATMLKFDSRMTPFAMLQFIHTSRDLRFLGARQLTVNVDDKVTSYKVEDYKSAVVGHQLQETIQIKVPVADLRTLANAKQVLFNLGPKLLDAEMTPTDRARLLPLVNYFDALKRAGTETNQPLALKRPSPNAQALAQRKETLAKQMESTYTIVQNRTEKFASIALTKGFTFTNEFIAMQLKTLCAQSLDLPTADSVELRLVHLTQPRLARLMVKNEGAFNIDGRTIRKSPEYKSQPVDELYAEVLTYSFSLDELRALALAKEVTIRVGELEEDFVIPTSHREQWKPLLEYMDAYKAAFEDRAFHDPVIP